MKLNNYAIANIVEFCHIKVIVDGQLLGTIRQLVYTGSTVVTRCDVTTGDDKYFLVKSSIIILYWTITQIVQRKIAY